jgi:hypothetical protein
MMKLTLIKRETTDLMLERQRQTRLDLEDHLPHDMPPIVGV